MQPHSFIELKELISNRISQIEVNRDKFTLTDKYKEDDLVGWIYVHYNGKTIVTFQYMVTNLHKGGGLTVRGSFTVKYLAYEKWYQDYLENGSRDVVHVDEFFTAHSSSNDRYEITYYLDKYLPIGNEDGKAKIAKAFEDNGVDKDKIFFDTRLKAYVVEMNLSQYLKKDEDKENESPVIRLYKYMSLSTYLCMLNYKTFRMNSIISMNDIYEGEWINHLLYGSDKVDDNKLRIDNIERKNVLVTSFTGNRDDGSMWRLYGNNGIGVCMGFEIPKKDVTKVIYVAANDENFLKLHNKLSILGKDGLSVVFKSAQDMRYIVKSSTFKVENEYRYLYDAS